MATSISDPSRARRLAGAIIADISLYNEDRIVRGIADGTLDEAVGDALTEGRELYDSRVDPALLARSRFLDAELVRAMRPRIVGPVWRSRLDVLRERLANDPACVECGAATGPDAVAFVGRETPGTWLRLLGCAKCLAVTGVQAADGAAELSAPRLEAGASTLVRLRERLTSAREIDALETEVERIQAGEPVLARLLGSVTLVEQVAPPSGVLVLRDASTVRDADPECRCPWPGVSPRLVPGAAIGAVERDEDSFVRAGTRFPFRGRDAEGWRLVPPGGDAHWCRLPEVRASHSGLTLEPE